MHKCHVARLTSLDFSLNAGVGGLLRVLFRQLLKCSTETTDMEILLAWHREPSNQGLPVVFVVENAESCESKILAELIMLLRRIAAKHKRSGCEVGIFATEIFASSR